MPEPKRPLKVFLCHASTDKPKVRELYRYLRKRGIQPWFDEEHLVGGQDWQVEIPKALATSDAIIICLTKNSVDKEGYIQKEIKFALDKALEMPEGRIFLIPVKFEECEVPFSLSRYQWVDLTIESGYAKMMKALKFRASQLERSTVELSKKTVEEENLAIEKPAKERAEREAAEKVTREKAEQEAAEKAQLEAEEQARQKATHVKAERETAEKAAREKAMRESAEKARREKEKREIPQAKPTRKPDKLEASKPELQSKQSNSGAQPLYWVAGLVGIVLVVWLSSLNGSPGVQVTTTPNLVSPTSQTSIAVISPTKTLLSTRTPIQTLIEASATPFIVYDPHPTTSDYVDHFGVHMRLVPAGEFTMGNNNGLVDESPARQEYLDAFYMDKYEVTNALYKVCVNEGVCSEPQIVSRLNSASFAYHPVAGVDWNQAKEYCEWRKSSLPTETQWEKAARGTDGRTYPWGEGFDCNKANYLSCNKGGTTEIGSYGDGVSPYGVYDLAGNVWELVTERLIRGGAWNYSENYLRASYRSGGVGGADYFVGFRCATNINP